jgi:hypothetical protein
MKRAVFLDQLDGARHGLLRVELVVAHQQLGLAAARAGRGVEFLDGEFGALLHRARLVGERAGQRNGQADADRLGLRPERHGRGAARGDQRAAGRLEHGAPAHQQGRGGRDQRCGSHGRLLSFE